jgi:hypothetical protein
MYLNPSVSASYSGGSFTGASGLINSGKVWNSISGTSNASFEIWTQTVGTTVATVTQTSNAIRTNKDVRFQSTTNFGPTTASIWSIEVWINVASANTSNLVSIITQVYPNTNINYAFGVIGTNPGEAVINMGGTVSGVARYSEINTPTLLNKGWQQLVGTLNGRAYKWYINGQAVSGATGNITNGALTLNTSSRTHLNNTANSNGGGLNADWGIMRMYSTVLTDAQVLQNFNANRGLYGL